jgi:hypothetical protein
MGAKIDFPTDLSSRKGCRGGLFMRRKASVPLGLWLLSLLSGSAWASDFDVLINEVNYNPFSGETRDEFIELFNRGGTAVNLSSWSFTEGVSFTFPFGTEIGPGEYLVVSPDAAHARTVLGITNVVGNFVGRLDNGGEILALSNADGAPLNRIHFGDGGPWPSHPDGLGPTLELAAPNEQNDLPQKWASSLVLGGTPGGKNSRYTPPRSSRTVVSEGDSFRYFKGSNGEPSSPMTRWTTRGFDASSWAQAPGAFGTTTNYWDEVGTLIDDLPGNYSTFYIRKTFDLDAATLADLGSGAMGLTLRIRFDDGFIAFVNGIEVGRMNMGDPGTAVPHDGGAADRLDDGSTAYDLYEFVGSLAAAGNVLALQGANYETSTDFLLGAELILSPGVLDVEEVKRTVVLNEIRPSEGGALGFVELYNRTPAAVTVEGWWIVDSLGHEFQIPPGSALGSGNFLTCTESQLGFKPSLDAHFALVDADGRTWVDGVNPRPGLSTMSFGRWPDGDEDQFLMASPSRGGTNGVSLEKNVVVNEILYHPVHVAPSGDCTRQCSDPDQWIELYNRGTAELEVGDWTVSKAVEFKIPVGTKIAGGGFLVIAADRTRFLSKHPSVPSARVVGGQPGNLWTGSLSRSSDQINLNDSFGNRIDHVEYADGEPTNDVVEVPPYGAGDGVDDRTLAASDWPKGADDGALGRTLELVNPALDNRAGSAWTPGPAGGTPGAANVGLSASPPPVIWDIEIEPVVPKSGEPVQVTCRASATSSLSRVEVLWHLDPAGGVTSVQLKDDGLSGDRLAGDGIYGGLIPAQANGSIVAFQVAARTADGRTATVPRSPAVAPYMGFQGPFCLYQVDDAPSPANGSTTYRILITRAELAALGEWYTQGSGDEYMRFFTNKLFHCTFIADGKAYQHVGLRYRGESTRGDDRTPWRIDLPSERKFRGMARMNFVSSNIQTEILAADLFRRSALPYMQEWTVNLVFNGDLDPLYVLKENFDGEFLDRFFGGSSGGNLYRAIDPMPAGGWPTGDLEYYGSVDDPTLITEDPPRTALDLYRAVYDKRSNGEDADWSDIADLCRALDRTETPDDVFVARISALIDPDEWARFFAVQACLTNNDGGIWGSSGEDYLLYRVPEDSMRDDAGKWLLLPWDIDETFDDSSERLFHPDVPGIRRVLTHPAFAPLYYANLIDLRDGAFSRMETRQRFYLIDRLFGFDTTDGLDTYITERIGFIDENIPVTLTAGMDGGGGTPLIRAGETWRFFRGTKEPSGGTRSWANRTFNDTSWEQGEMGIGYADGDDATLLTDMEGAYTTVYLRRAFAVANPTQIQGLFLDIDYDDGFVAFLNGNEVARVNVDGNSGDLVPFDSVADASHEAGTAERFDISAFRDRLIAGNNVLAIVGLNQAIDSSDFSLSPALYATLPAAGGGCGTILFAAGADISLSGRSDAARTRVVKLNGAAASYDPYRARWTALLTVPAGESTVRVEAFDGIGNKIASLDVKVIRTTRVLTELRGTLSANTTWTEAGGPYILAADVIVPAGIKLTIGPGAFILGQGNASIIVRGTLDAQGTAEKPIRFRALSCETMMGGIAFDATGTAAASPEHHIRYLDIEFAQNPADYSGTIAPVSSKLLVEDSTFRDMTANAIDGTEARVEVRRCLFERIHEGVHCTSSTVVVVDSTFSHMVGDKDAIDFDLNSASGERSRIERNLIEYSSDDGVDLQATSVDIRDNVFRFISDKVMSLEEDGPVGHPTITGNLVYSSGTGIALKSGVVVTEGHHNTIVGCQEGINLWAKAGAADGGHGTFHSMIVWNNIYDVKLDTRSTIAITYSDVDGGVWPGTGNISVDPKFADVGRDDFSLAAGSPAIRTGKDATDMGAIPYSGALVFFVRGDRDANGQIQMADITGSLDYLFKSGAGPSCLDRLDANDDGAINISDPIYLLFYLYGSGSQPPQPFPGAGVDATGDALECR